MIGLKNLWVLDHLKLEMIYLKSYKFLEITFLI